MTLEVFRLLKENGDEAGADHILVGKAADMLRVAKVLDQILAENRRLKSVAALSERFHEAATTPAPLLRLTKMECRLLVERISEFAANKAKTTIASQLSRHFEVAIAVY